MCACVCASVCVCVCVCMRVCAKFTCVCVCVCIYNAQILNHLLFFHFTFHLVLNVLVINEMHTAV